MNERPDPCAGTDVAALDDRRRMNKRVTVHGFS
jgi:hypothetical protein